MIKKYIQLARPHHYIKNILLFFPLVFSGNLLNKNLFFTTLLGFFAFSFVASAIYIINDIFDAEKDNLHPVKRKRPIASGAISKKSGFIFLIFLLILGVLINLHITSKFNSFALLILYLLLNLGYSVGLKQIPLVDIIILVSGYLIRVLYGSSIIEIPVSNWLYLTVIAISCYLAFGKRRNELARQGPLSRNVLKYYTYEFLDKNMYLSNALIIVFYSLWCTDSLVIEKFSNNLVWTVPLVLLISMKYSLNIEGDSDGDPVEIITKDKILVSLFLLYIVVIFSIIYLPCLI